jgi:hypothetical protein
MSVFRGATYLYILQDLIKVRVSARNVVGWGSTSTPNTSGATVRDVPAAVTTPLKGAGTSESQIEVDWAALTATTDTGDSPILSYYLEWDKGTSGPQTWYDLVGFPTNSLLLSYLVSSTVTAGTSY